MIKLRERKAGGHASETRTQTIKLTGDGVDVVVFSLPMVTLANDECDLLRLEEQVIRGHNIQTLLDFIECPNFI